VSPSFRTAINIPQSIWPQFREKLNVVGASLLNAESKLQLAEHAGVADENDSSASLFTDTAVGTDQTDSSTCVAVDLF